MSSNISSSPTYKSIGQQSTIAESIGVAAESLPLCLDCLWLVPPLLDEDRRQVLNLLALLLKERSITEAAAIDLLTEWWPAHRALVLSEVSHAYASEKRLTCELLKSKIGRYCEAEYCDYSRWCRERGAAKLEAMSRVARRRKGAAMAQEVQGSASEPVALPTQKDAPEIEARARAILEQGNPLQFIVDSCGREVLGAEKAFKKLICCMAVQGVKQSAGLHPKLNGESGTGKTLAVLTFAHHLPAEAVVKGSTSNLAAFYHNDGVQVFRILDDYVAGNETLDTIIKQTSSVFHQRYTHRTVKKQDPITLEIGSEQTWAITSVDSSQDIQVLNRQIPINVDDSEDLTRKVNIRTIERYGKGEEQFPEDETVQVSRAIWRLLRADGLIDVKVPFWERIEWLDTSNRRNPSIFMDLLIAHTAMFRHQREQDEDGYYLATEADFEAAKALFADKDAEELVHRLTRKEREFADLLAKHPEGLTREQVAEALNVRAPRVSQLANGEKGRGGLAQKLPGFSADEVMDSIVIGADKRRSIKRTIYRLSKYDPLTGFEAVVRLQPENAINQTSKDGKDAVRLPVRKCDNKDIAIREREYREIEIGSKESKEKVREGSERDESSLSLRNEEKSLLDHESAPSGSVLSLRAPLRHPYRPYANPPDSGNESLLEELAEGDRRQAEREAHFRTPGPDDGILQEADILEKATFKRKNRFIASAAIELQEFDTADLAAAAKVTKEAALAFLNEAMKLNLVFRGPPAGRWRWVESPPRPASLGKSPSGRGLYLWAKADIDGPQHSPV